MKKACSRYLKCQEHRQEGISRCREFFIFWSNFQPSSGRIWTFTTSKTLYKGIVDTCFTSKAATSPHKAFWLSKFLRKSYITTYKILSNIVALSYQYNSWLHMKKGFVSWNAKFYMLIKHFFITHVYQHFLEYSFICIWWIMVKYLQSEGWFNRFDSLH